MAHGVENIFLWENFFLVWKFSYKNIDRKSIIIFTVKLKNLARLSRAKLYLGAFN